MKRIVGEKSKGQAMNKPENRICAFCEYFDGGGEAIVLAGISQGVSLGGDFSNRLAPHFETKSTDTCDFFLSSQDADGMESGIK